MPNITDGNETHQYHLVNFYKNKKKSSFSILILLSRIPSVFILKIQI